MELFRVENLSFRYPKAERDALQEINLSVQSGEFIVLCGASGCGKTTLLRLLKKELAPVGEKNGRILYAGAPQEALTNAGEIGFVQQNPESQIVTDKVWHELAFGLENLGLPTEMIRRRVGEMASFFGMQGWFRQKTDALSGGQKQLLNLASVMVMQPKLLILDEPTGQLDPIAAADFIATLQKINRELGLTILLAEHRLEEVFPIADRVLVLENGRILLDDEPRKIGLRLSKLHCDHPMLHALPSAVRIWQGLHMDDTCPLTVREGREFLERHFENRAETLPEPETPRIDETAVELKNVWFRYEKDAPDVLRGVSAKVYQGEIFCMLGGNGVGKTTALNMLAGLDKPYRGKVLVGGKPIKDYKGGTLYRRGLALLPQNPETVFVKDTVRADLAEILEVMEIPRSEHAAQIEKIAEKLGIVHLLDRHPFDISGGEQQKSALAKVLLSEPKILLLDEPTKGIDAFAKSNLREILRKLKRDGMTVVLVTHDVEFAAETADRCAFVFDGEILSADPPQKFFAENSFYTTAANRMARGLWKNAVTCEQVIEGCRTAGGQL